MTLNALAESSSFNTSAVGGGHGHLVKVTATDPFNSTVEKDIYIIVTQNEAPKFINYSIVIDGEFSDSVTVPLSGDPIPQVLEVSMSDPDGLSSVQVKMGRLAPIGESNSWILMKDDGDGVDRVANDGVYSLEIFPRSSLPNGEIEIFVRGTDIYLSTTDVNDQNLILKLDKIEQSTADNWISENQSLLIVIGLSFVLLLAFAGILMVLRNSEID